MDLFSLAKGNDEPAKRGNLVAEINKAVAGLSPTLIDVVATHPRVKAALLRYDTSTVLEAIESLLIRKE